MLFLKTSDVNISNITLDYFTHPCGSSRTTRRAYENLLVGAGEEVAGTHGAVSMASTGTSAGASLLRSIW